MRKFIFATLLFAGTSLFCTPAYEKIEDKNTLILSRLQAQKPRRLRHKP